MPEMMTPRQRGFIAALHAELGIAHESGVQRTKQQASEEIGRLLQMRGQRRPAPAAGLTRESAGPTEPGMYRSADGSIFKVQRSQQGGLYAMRLTPINGQRMSEINDVVAWKFVYERGAIRQLRATDKLTLEQAREFGIRYGVCCVCSTTLTDATSVARGIGPVCERRLTGRTRSAVQTDRHAPRTETAAEQVARVSEQFAANQAARNVPQPLVDSYNASAQAVAMQQEMRFEDTNMEERELERQLRASIQYNNERQRARGSR